MYHNYANNSTDINESVDIFYKKYCKYKIKYLDLRRKSIGKVSNNPTNLKNLRHCTKLSYNIQKNQTGGLTNNQVIPVINSELASKFMVNQIEDLDLLNKTNPQNKYFNKKKSLPSPSECIHIRKLIVNKIDCLQRSLFAQRKYAVLLIFQGLDAAGKDSCIFRVFKGVNPAGFQITGFQQPSKKESLHNFLWRSTLKLPEKGKIGIFNRSYYEDVLVTKVHPDILKNQGIEKINKEFWESRYESIRNYEKHLSNNGVLILKFFLNVSKEQQAYRLWKRLMNNDMTWKFSKTDLIERKFWNEYMQAFQEAIIATNTSYAPWFIIPSDNKHYLRMTVAQILESALRNMNIPKPKLQSGITSEIINKSLKHLETSQQGVSLYHKKTYSEDKHDDELSELEYPLDNTTTQNLEKIFNKYKNDLGFLIKYDFFNDFNLLFKSDKNLTIFNKENNIDLGLFLKKVSLLDIANDIINY